MGRRMFVFCFCSRDSIRANSCRNTSWDTRSNRLYSPGSRSNLLYNRCCTPRDFSSIHGFTQHDRCFRRSRKLSSSVSSRAAAIAAYRRFIEASMLCVGDSGERAERGLSTLTSVRQSRPPCERRSWSSGGAPTVTSPPPSDFSAGKLPRVNTA